MERNTRFYRCPVCGNVIGLIEGDASRIVCCGKQMEQLVPNTVDASVEKHTPVCEVKGDNLVVTVGSIMHPMTEEHYISWVAIVSNNKTTRVRLNPNDTPAVVLPYEKNSTVYAYCNLHGLWATEV